MAFDTNIAARWSIMAAGVAAALLTPMTCAAQIVRHANPGATPSLILQSVTIPAGAKSVTVPPSNCHQVRAQGLPSTVTDTAPL